LISEDKLENLRDYLIKVNQKRLSKIDISKLIAISKSIIIPYLLNTKRHFLNLFSIHGLDVNDIALDILGDVFYQNNDCELIKIKSFINSLITNILDIKTETLFFAYQSFLRKMTDAYIARSYAELDPMGFKIKRNIIDTLPTRNLLLRKTILGNLIYVKNNGTYQNLPYPDLEELENIFLSKTRKRLTTRQLLNILHTVLMEMNFRKEILLNDTVTLFKKYYEIILENISPSDSYEISNASFLECYEIEELCTNVLKYIKSKIFIEYYAKRKLTIEQANGLNSAIYDIVSDIIKIDKNNLSFYEYLNKYINLSKEEYELKYKSKLEYLIKLVRIKFRDYLLSKE